MPFPIGFNRTGARRPTNANEARPAGAQPPAQPAGADVPQDPPRLLPRGLLRRNPMQAQLLAQQREQQRLATWNTWADENVPEAQRAARQAAVQQMRQAGSYRDFPWLVSVLDFRDQGLTSLPSHLPEVSALLLNNNALTELPDDLPDSIQRLFVVNNQLTRLPQRLPASLSMLCVDRNQLTQLPEQLPVHLNELRVQHNQLTHLPQRLPRGLTQLAADHNQLTQLPPQLPPRLHWLGVENNQLTRLPDTLPRRVRVLTVSANALTDLPRRLPPQMSILDLRDNQLTEVSPSLLRCMSDFGEIRLAGNPLSEAAIHGLWLHRSGSYRLTGLPDPYTARPPQAPVAQRPPPAAQPPQPVRHMAPPQPPPQPALQPIPREIPQLPPPQPLQRVQAGEEPTAVTARSPLAQAVLGWTPPPNTHISAAMRQWEQFAHEPGAEAFAQFLERLRGTVNFSDPDFQRSVIQWLSNLANNPALRRDTFAASVGATESCQDRISLTYNSLRKLSMASDVARGQYDQRLPDLIELARGMFRLDQLETIANEHATRMERALGQQNVDPIEVYLAYQVELREPMALPVDTARMAYHAMSGVTAEDINRAHARVLDAERHGFADYLAVEFAPWQEVLRRLDPTGHEQTQETLIDAMGDEFTHRLSTRLQEMGLAGDADAERTLGPQVQAEITREINGRLTRDFLARHGLLEQISSSQQRHTAEMRR